MHGLFIKKNKLLSIIKLNYYYKKFSKVVQDSNKI